MARRVVQRLLDAICDIVVKIKRALSSGIQAISIKGQKEAFRDLRGREEKMARLLGEALERTRDWDAENENAATEDGAARYSLRTFEDSTKYVDVDGDQSIFDGLSVSEMQKAAKNEITKRFKGKVIGTDYTTYVDRNSARHYAYPANRRMDTQQKQNKMRAPTELDKQVRSVKTFLMTDGTQPQREGLINLTPFFV